MTKRKISELEQDSFTRDKLQARSNRTPDFSIIAAPTPKMVDSIQQDLDRKLDRDLDRILEEKSRKWGFDFKAGIPLPNSDIKWVQVEPAAASASASAPVILPSPQRSAMGLK